MRKLMFLALFLVCLQPAAKAQATLIPAGTLLHCTIDDPTISPKTAQVGDPVLCHLHQISEFGRPAFPRGSYLAGHLEAAKQPGHFIGKGYLGIVFDHIGMPNADGDLDARIVAAQGQHVDKQGDIVGHGHAKRDIVEWMIPPPPAQVEERATCHSESDARCGVASVNGIFIAIVAGAPIWKPGRVRKPERAYAILYAAIGGNFRETIRQFFHGGPFVQDVLRPTHRSCVGLARERNASRSFDQAGAVKRARPQPDAGGAEIGDDLSGEGLLGGGQAACLRAA
jgi:hypothetical protein